MLQTPDKTWRVEVRSTGCSLYYLGGLVRGPRSSMDEVVAWMLTHDGNPEDLVEVGGTPVTYRAVAYDWDPARHSFTLVVLRDDGHEVWGDQPIRAADAADVPRAAIARLQPPVVWRVTGEWLREETRLGPRWTAPVESRL